MSEMTSAIKQGSIVLYIYGSGSSDADMLLNYVGEIGAPACGPKRWLVAFFHQSFNCTENELVWLMDLPEDKRGKTFLETFLEFQNQIFAAALRELRTKQLEARQLEFRKDTKNFVLLRQ